MPGIGRKTLCGAGDAAWENFPLGIWRRRMGKVAGNPCGRLKSYGAPQCTLDKTTIIGYNGIDRCLTYDAGGTT